MADNKSVDVTVKKKKRKNNVLADAKASYIHMNSALQNPAGFILQQEEGFIMTDYIVNETLSIVNEGVGFTANNIGNWTGDIGAAHTAQAMQISFGVAKEAINIGLKPLAGARIAMSMINTRSRKAMNSATALGMFVGGGFALVSAGVSAGKKLYEFNVGTAATERGVMFNKARAGALLNNWSR